MIRIKQFYNPINTLQVTRDLHNNIFEDLMVKVVLIVKRGEQVMMRKEYGSLEINQRNIEKEIVGLTSLDIQLFQIFYLDSENDEITITAEDDYEIAKEDIAQEYITFIAKCNTQQHITLLEPKLSAAPPIQLIPQSTLHTLELQVPAIEEKNQKVLKGKEKKEKSKAKKVGDVQVKKEKAKKQKKKETNEIDQIQLQRKMELMMHKLLKQECFISKLQQEKTGIKYQPINKPSQKKCTQCLSKIETVPFYLNNRNEVFCQSCESHLQGTQSLVKIKNKDYLISLIAAKEISVHWSDLSGQQLAEIEKKQQQISLIKFTKNIANLKLATLFNEEIQSAKMDDLNRKKQKKQAQRLLKKQKDQAKKAMKAKVQLKGKQSQDSSGSVQMMC